MRRLLALAAVLAAGTVTGGAQAQTLLLDPDYGSTDVTGFNIRIADFQVDADGRALVVRGTGLPPSTELNVFRVDTQGRLDPAFGTGGRRTLPVPRDTSRSTLFAHGQVLPQADGTARVVVSAGGALMTGRLLGDGTLDPAFLPDGLRRVSSPLLLDLVDARADGPRTLALSRHSFGPQKCALTALTAGGQPDPAFGTGGTAFAPTDRICLPLGVVLTRDGPLVLARLWTSDTETAERAALFAFTPAGEVRTSFGDGGVVVLPFAEGTFEAGNAIAWSGRVVIGGTSGPDLVLAAYTEAGVPDPTFNGGAGTFRVAPRRGSPAAGVVGLVEAGDGSLVFTTSTEANGVSGPAAGVFTSAGAFAPQAAEDGLFSRQYSYADIRLYPYRGSATAVDKAGGILLAGAMTLSGSSFQGARLTRLAVRSATAAEAANGTSAVRSAVAPNPASTSARVTVALDTAADARVTVLDALGRTVAILHDGPLAAGETTLALDAARLPSGVYAVAVQAGALRQTARVTVVR